MSKFQDNYNVALSTITSISTGNETTLENIFKSLTTLNTTQKFVIERPNNIIIVTINDKLVVIIGCSNHFVILDIVKNDKLSTIESRYYLPEEINIQMFYLMLCFVDRRNIKCISENSFELIDETGEDDPMCIKYVGENYWEVGKTTRNFYDLVAMI